MRELGWSELDSGSLGFGVAEANRGNFVDWGIGVDKKAEAAIVDSRIWGKSEGITTATGRELGDDLAIVGGKGDGAGVPDQNQWRDGSARRVGLDRESPGSAGESGASNLIRKTDFG